MNQLKVYAKAIAAFVFGVVANLVVNLVHGTTPWPHSTTDWVQLVVTSFGAAIGALLTPAKVSDRQVEKDPTIVRVNPETQAPVPGQFHNPWKS